MNWEAKKLLMRRQDEVDALGGEAAYRLQALYHLRLKTVVKESHATTVQALCFNHAAPESSNLFATVGADQATVYDDEHMANHVAMVVHFQNQSTEHAAGGELQAACWLSCQGWTSHPHGDACLAVAGADPSISIISVVEARVVKLLKGHTKDVVEMAATASHSRLLVSLSRDGNLRLWDVAAETCLASITAADATSVAFAPDGCSVAVGTSRGKIYRYAVEHSDAEAAGAAVAAMAESSKEELKTQGNGHSEAVDCMRFLPGGRLATKSSDGRMHVWDVSNGESKATWKVPGCNGAGGFSSRCQFGPTSDGKYIAVGNASGDCYVYDSETGKREAHVSAIKVSAPVRACALSSDCRHLLAAVGKGFVFRFEYLKEVTEEEEEANEPENEDGNAADEAAV